MSAGESPSPEELGVDRLEALNHALSRQVGWSSDFQQEYLPVGMTFGEEVAGRVWLAWPDRALFHTGDPAERLMGMKGRLVRLVDLADGTCDEHQLTDREWERVPLAAILDPRGAAVHFGVLAVGGSDLVLTPKEAGGVDRVEITLGTDGLPVRVVIIDPQGAENRLSFGRWTSGEGPPEGRWLPAPPSGVECLADRGALD